MTDVDRWVDAQWPHDIRTRPAVLSHLMVWVRGTGEMGREITQVPDGLLRRSEANNCRSPGLGEEQPIRGIKPDEEPMSPQVGLRVDVEGVGDDEKGGCHPPFRPRMPLNGDVSSSYTRDTVSRR